MSKHDMRDGEIGILIQSLPKQFDPVNSLASVPDHPIKSFRIQLQGTQRSSSYLFQRFVSSGCHQNTFPEFSAHVGRKHMYSGENLVLAGGFGLGGTKHVSACWVNHASREQITGADLLRAPGNQHAYVRSSPTDFEGEWPV